MDTTIDPQPHPHQPNEPENIVLDLYAIKHLRETRKWTNFVSIAAFVLIGLMILIAMIMMIFLFSSRGGIVGMMPIFPLAVMTAVYSFPIYYLYQFSKFAKQAVDEYDALALSQALRYLKMHYRYVGIVLIIVLAFYVVIGGFALVSGRLMGMFG
ncbi:MAG TPA: hypothetical protein VGD22_06255 [Sphingobacteriaceae bacterium]